MYCEYRVRDLCTGGPTPEVTLLAVGFLHSVQRAHSSVLFQTHTVREEILSWSLGGRREQRPHHH